MTRPFNQEAALGASEYERNRLKLLQKSERDLFWYTTVKRVIDVCGALFGLVFFAPLFLVVAVLIKLEDPKGPVLFKQTRIGKGGKPFKMYKFRSMVHDAEERLGELLDKNEIRGAMFKIRNDPRVTRVGKFIRRTSIDELPQLINVLKGEMSLVGPRPPLPREVAEYTEYDKLRLTVMSGCTGLWQVSGRSHLSFEQMVELDLEYIQKRSIAGDLKIIFKTFRLLFGAKDAF